MKRTDRRGFMLISSYVLLSIFIIYSNAIAVRTFTHAKAVDRLRERLQAADLAQGAIEQLREDLYYFLTTIIYQQAYLGDATDALTWLDSLGQVLNGTAMSEQDGIMFDLPFTDLNGDGRVTAADLPGDELRDGTPQNPRAISLPPLRAPTTEYARAWISSVCVHPEEEGPLQDCRPDTNPLAARLVTMQAEARVMGSTRRLEATYEIALGPSDVFRYAYFVNNYGWMDPGGGWIGIHGEARSNGDLAFNGDMADLRIQGDVYASENPNLINPKTGLAAAGVITGDPSDLAGAYWYHSGVRTRPARRLTLPGQPAIGGTAQYLPYGYGYDEEGPRQRFERQPTQAMPYLGNLDLYKTIAQTRGSTLAMYDWDTGTWTPIPGVTNGVYEAATPLILDGSSRRTIYINGPIVANGDVIIKGNISGQGTIYAGRNVHIVGDILYADPPGWPALERNQDTGEIRQDPYYPTPLGTVCNDGSYYGVGETPPLTCMN